MEGKAHVVMDRLVVYTAIFGPYDSLKKPKVRPKGVDFVCFTDQDIRSDVWQIRKVVMPIEGDPVRSARMYKILPHRYLGSYDVSVWVDGNLEIRGDLQEAAEKYLETFAMAVYDHAFAKNMDKSRSRDNLNNPYEQAAKIFELAAKGRKKDGPEVVRMQMDIYRKEGFPEDTGVLLSQVLYRKHRDEKVVVAMEEWWKQIKLHSKRDQLSFNYVAWKKHLNFLYIKENARENEYVIWRKHN